MTLGRRWQLLTASSLAILSIPVTVYAQVQVQDIVVTARKREETLQSVPIAVSAFTPNRLDREQVRDVQDLNLAAPNFVIGRNVTTSNSTQIFIRGIGSVESTYNAEQRVATYVDGVYLGQARGSLLDLIDIDRIEVLRGPQGTLYGRNSTGGAIKVVTKRPSLTQAGGFVDVEGGRFDGFEFRGSVGAPLIQDKLAFKLDALSRDRGTYVEDRTHQETINDLRRRSVRLSVLAVPTEKLSAYLTADYTVDNSAIQAPVPVKLDASGNVVPLYGRYVVDRSIPNLQRFTGWGVSAELNYDLGWGKLQSVTSARGFHHDLAGDLDGTNLSLIDFIEHPKYHQITEEVQLTASPIQNLDVVTGVFYLNSHVRSDALNLFQNTSNVNIQDSNSVAVYGEASWKFLPGASLTVGARQSWDEKTMDASGAQIGTGANPFAARRSVNFHAFTPRVVLDYKPVRDVTVYASWSRGYTAGVFVQGRPAGALAAIQTTDPEDIDSYEVGLKSLLLENRLRANFALFTSDFTNQQNYFVTNTFITTTARQRYKGAEAEITAQLVRNWNVSFTGALLSSRYLQLPKDPRTGIVLGGVSAGDQAAFVPKRQARIASDYTFDLWGGRLTIAGDYTWSSAIFYDNPNSPSIRRPALGLLNAQVSYETGDGNWRFEVGGKNITNKWYWEMAQNLSFLPPVLFGQAMPQGAVFVSPPATWTVSLRRRF